MQPSLPTALAPELFSESHFADSYQCSICRQVPLPELASNHAKCGAIFCKSCLDSWLLRNHDCPNCRGHASTNLNRQDNRIVYQLHQRLVLRCPNSDKCPWKGQLGDLRLHFRDCSYVRMECKYAVAGCKFEGCKAELAAHEAEKKDDHLSLCLITINELKGGSHNGSSKPQIREEEEEKMYRGLLLPTRPEAVPQAREEQKEDAKERIDRNVRSIIEKCNALTELHKCIRSEAGSVYQGNRAGNGSHQRKESGPDVDEDNGFGLFD